VTPGYFQVAGTRLTQGREFAAGDRAQAGDLAMVNEEMARRLWPGASPLGRRIRFGDRPWRTVIGVVADVRSGLAARPQPFAYVPLASEPGAEITFVLHADADAVALAPALRAAVRAVDSDQPVDRVMTRAAALREQAAPSRFVAMLMTALSVVALSLAAVGVYGVTAHAVRGRLREIGIRLALGGTRPAILRMIVISAWRAIAPGLVVGATAASVATRVLSGVLYGTSPTDPAVFAAVAVTLAGVASVASYLPARRAARVDPIAVLRQQ
jgi:putative ABC transport system permease protein